MWSSPAEDEDLQSRQRCTDLPCCLVFLVSMGLFGTMYVNLMASGNSARLFHGIDYAGQVCGVDEQVKHQPYLYWCMKSLTAGMPDINFDQPVCVQSCPGEGVTGATSGATYEVVPDCQYVTGPEGMSSYKTELIFNRFCLPDTSMYRGIAQELAKNKLAGADVTLMESVSSIAAAWPALLGSFFLAIIMGYVFLALLRHCAEPLIYMSILLSVVGFSMLGIWLIANAGTVSSQVQTSADVNVALPKSFSDNEEVVTKVFGAVCLGLAALSLCLGCFFHHSIQVGSACVEVACDTMFEMPSLLMLPVLKAFLKGGLLVILLAGFLELWSTSPVTQGDDGKSPHWSHDEAQWVQVILYMLMSFWILAFVNALYQFAIAYAVAEYYYTPYDHDGEKDVGCCSLWDGLYYGLLLHGGSLALGSLLVAILQVLQKLVEYAEKQNEESGSNPVICIVLCMLGLCINCCKDIVQFINKNAYIDIAITSNNFCAAAKDAMVMIAELGGAMAILNGATFVFTLFGVVLISMGSAASTYFIVIQGVFVEQDSEFEVSNPVAAAAVGGLIGLLVALAFMHVFDMTSDTLLYCYGYDLHRNKPATTAPAALKELVHGGE
mmetsp:Transcript_55120/g.120608  ORF Transcript_55120/g.120608 Transcript_55120/m.120608 type:complete len:608 (+) Transcript_55120:109-1932(+)